MILSNRNYFAPSWVFSSVNILIGTWILYIPHIKMKFALDDSQVGFALFFTAIGLLISIPFVPYLNKKLGVGRSTQIGILVLAVLFNLPLLAANYISLCGSLLLTGILSGFTSTSMNSLVSIIENRNNNNFMSAAHGFFSLGGFLGAGIGSFLILQFSNPSYHMLLMSSLVIVTNLFLSKNYSAIKEAPQSEHQEKTNIFKNINPVFGLSIIAFIIFFNEGAVEHWSNLFLFDMVQVTESQAGYGFVIFSLTMTLGRFLGDGVSRRLGSIKTMGAGLIIAAMAYLLILTADLFISVLGFGVLGLGISVIIPELFRMAGRSKQLSTSVAISVVSGIGFLGFLVGPVLLGFISNWSSLMMSYVFLLLLIITAFALVVFRLRSKYSASKTEITE
ncbi:membrane protein mosC [Nonlabens marinus S1-08]|uniref:Membrane protein mosC n=2 Tax=Nonlabens TaxID=363408 RepID=W8VS62_9FLAO|nr:membrane protein mosC [Nonlabens marinus S1-08]